MIVSSDKAWRAAAAGLWLALLYTGALARPAGGGAAAPRIELVAPEGTAASPAARVVVSIPARWLVFHREDERYAATARLTVSVLRDGRLLGGDVAERIVTADRYGQTRTGQRHELSLAVALPDTAPVTLAVTVGCVGTRRRWQRELAYAAGRAAAIPLRIVAARWVTPGQERMLLAPWDSVALHLRATAAAASGADTVRLELVAAPVAGGESSVVDRTAVTAAPGETLTVVLGATVRDLPFGEHELALRLDGRALAGLSRLDLFVLAVHWWDDRAWALQVGWLDGIVDQAARDSLRHLPTAERAAAWRRIWEERGPGALPTEREHLLRIVEADRRFGGFGRGALSDRGRVYIRHGEPDRIEEFEDTRTYPGRWEVWYYDRLGVAYRFHDSFGLGDYRLYDTVPY